MEAGKQRHASETVSKNLSSVGLSHGKNRINVREQQHQHTATSDARARKAEVKFRDLCFDLIAKVRSGKVGSGTAEGKYQPYRLVFRLDIHFWFLSLNSSQ